MEQDDCSVSLVKAPAVKLNSSGSVSLLFSKLNKPGFKTFSEDNLLWKLPSCAVLVCLVLDGINIVGNKHSLSLVCLLIADRIGE